jgi:nitroreductase
MKYNLTELNAVIRNRRSIKPEFFSGEDIPDGSLEQLLENARWAPTHGLTQPWSFKIFQKEGLKRLADWQAATYRQVTGEEKFNSKKYEKLSSRPVLSSVVIAVCMKRQETEKIPEVEELASVACAVQNMFLTATGMGLAAYWGSGGLTYTSEMRDYLGLGSKDQCLGFFYLGMPGRNVADSEREPVSAFTKFILD